MPALVVAALDAALPLLPAPQARVAVRSSAAAGDGAAASFAGQYTTRLGMRGQDEMLAAILACRRSFFTPHALATRIKHTDLGQQGAMAVLIMPLVEAE